MTTTSMHLTDVEHHLDVSGTITGNLRETAGSVVSLETACIAACDGAPGTVALASIGMLDLWASNDSNLRSIWSTLSQHGGSLNSSAVSSITGLDIPDGSYSPFDDAMFSLQQILIPLDTARQDRDDGLGKKAADQIWSVNDLKAMAENEKGYYTPEQVAHAKKVLAMIEASPEARELLGITESGGGWSWSDIGHLTLDVFGMVPVVGNAADGINAAWYASEGKYLDAALSSMALIPAVGQAVTMSKPAIKAAAGGRTFSSLDEALQWAKKWLQDKGILKADGTPNPNQVDGAAGGEFIDDALRAADSPLPPTTTVDNILDSPSSLLTGRTPQEVQSALGATPGWKVESLGQGSHAGQGWVLREYTEQGNPTGRMLRWHPGGGHHGPDPYWRVNTHQGKSDIIPG